MSAWCSITYAWRLMPVALSL